MIFILLEIESEKLFKYLMIYLKIVTMNILYVNSILGLLRD